MGEHRPAGDQVPEELLGGVDAGRSLGVVGGVVAVVTIGTVVRVRVCVGRRRVVGIVPVVGGLSLVVVVVAVDEVLQPRPVDLV